MGALGWAVALSVLSSASYAAAAVAQERLAEHGQRGVSRWAVALLLTAGGVGLHLVALDFGTVAVVQALGTLTLLFALPISVLRYRMRVGLAAWADAALTVAGLALIMSLSVESSEPAAISTTTGRYLVLITFVVVAVMILGAWPSGPLMRGVLLAGAAGVAFGMASVLSKAILTAFTDGGLGAVSVFAAAMVGLFSVVGYALGQLSYRGAGLAAPLATVSVVNPLVAAVAGMVVFDEGFRFGTVGLLIIGVAALAITFGVIGLARRTAAGSVASATGPAESAAASEDSATSPTGSAAASEDPATPPGSDREPIPAPAARPAP